MMTYHGKSIYAATAIGNAFVFRHQDRNVPKKHVDDAACELKRIEAAGELAKKQLREIYESAVKEVGETDARIFDVHMMLLDDTDYNEFLRDLIVTSSVNAEYAVAVAAEHFSGIFASMEDPYMQARSADVRDISDRLITALRGTRNGTDSLSEKTVICADDLSPSEIVSLDKDRILAFVTACGSTDSHTAILARSRGIPAIVGVGGEFLDAVKDGMKIIVDGHTGEITLEPDEEAVNRILVKQEEDRQTTALLRELKGRQNITADGRKISICANIGGIGDINAVHESDADGIGLFRSEFLYLESGHSPTEEEQFQAYRRVLESMSGKRVIIRTLDIGADKQIDYFHLDKEANPALGLRAIRICLTRPELFKTQLHALYRASAYGRLGILFPMITGVPEVKEILSVCEEVKAELREAEIPFDERAELGIMIETPAAAVLSDLLAPLVDFFSVGTNDLTQYALAIDRQNTKLERFCDPHHEAVLRLIRITAENAHKHGVRIGICGELAADLSLTETFLRMGIDELSVSSPFILPLRDKVRKLDLSE